MQALFIQKIFDFCSGGMKIRSPSWDVTSVRSKALNYEWERLWKDYSKCGVETDEIIIIYQPYMDAGFWPLSIVQIS